MEGQRWIVLPHGTSKWEEYKEFLEKRVSVKHFIKFLQMQTDSHSDFTALTDAVVNITGARTLQHCIQWFGELLPFIQKQILRLPEFFPDGRMPALWPGIEDTVTLPREAVLCLLGCCFFCLFDESYRTQRQDAPGKKESSGDTMPYCNWGRMMKWHSAHATFGLYYFDRCRKEMPTGELVITRRVLQQIPKKTDWTTLHAELLPVQFSLTTLIEDVQPSLHADFANAYIGGGVLNGGAVQEEIRFCINPELFVTMILVGKMKDEEAVHIFGAERFSDYRGYGGSLQWDGPHQDAHKDSDGQPLTEIVAYDAISLWRSSGSEWDTEAKLRELNKALIAFIPLTKKSKLPTSTTSSTPKQTQPTTTPTLNETKAATWNQPDSITQGDDWEGSEPWDKAQSNPPEPAAPPALPAGQTINSDDDPTELTTAPTRETDGGSSTSEKTEDLLGDLEITGSTTQTQQSAYDTSTAQHGADTREDTSKTASDDTPVSTSTDIPVSTGHWGCGVFGGSKELKFLIQWMSASAVNRGMHYNTQNEGALTTTFSHVVDCCTGKLECAGEQPPVTVGELCRLVMKFDSTHNYRHSGICQWLLDKWKPVF